MQLFLRSPFYPVKSFRNDLKPAQHDVASVNDGLI